MKKLINGNIFNGRHFTGDSVVYVEGDRITGLSASSDTQDQPETEVIDLNGGSLVPGFIALHVMGGSGVYFSNEPTADAIERTAGAHMKSGITSWLPNLISAPPETIFKAISATRDAMQQIPGTVWGMHL